MCHSRQTVHRVLLAAVVILSAGQAAEAAQRIKTMCQMRLRDNDISVEDGTVLPPSWVGFKLLHYTPTSSKDGFSRGPCEVTARR